MDLGPRDGHLSIPMPFPSHYPNVPDSARVQLFAGGNGVPAEEMRPPEVKSPKEVVRYRDCRRNHAANIGGHVLDGCCEFMPGGEQGSADALKCAACGCHRNFHRREVEGEICCDCHRSRRDRKRMVPYGAPNQSPLSVLPSRDGVVSQNPQMVMALNSTQTDSDDPDAPHAHLGSSMRKRFRTKFTAEQKEKMRLFAERLGWKIQKQDEPDVQQFCNDISVKRNVLKVWMHNNKNTVGKKMENGSDLLKARDCSSDLS